MKQELIQQNAKKGDQISSISSANFDSLNEATKMNETQKYRNSHYTVKDKNELVNAYESFFETEYVANSSSNKNS